MRVLLSYQHLARPHLLVYIDLKQYRIRSRCGRIVKSIAVKALDVRIMTGYIESALATRRQRRLEAICL